MTLERTRRSLLVRQLVEWQRSPAELLSELRSFPWDCESPLVVLTRPHMARALDRYLTGACDSHELVEWANAVELREDIELEPGHVELLEQTIVEITMAGAFGGAHGLTHARVRAFREQMHVR